MATLQLPNDPDFEQLRTQARELQRAVRRGDPDSIAIVAEHHPDGAPPAQALATFPLAAAQLVTARRYEFASWPKLKHHLTVVAEHSWRPDDVRTDESTADTFLRLACLDYSNDDPVRRAEARELLAGHPEIAGSSIYVAAAMADVGAVRSFVAADRGTAIRAGGPFHWAPIFHLVYARHDPSVSERATLETARILLDHGADPNTGYLWHGMPSPFTLITGCFGEGELGPIAQPEHPHGFALARLLLDAGAEANDSQALYNRMFEPGVAHLELLFEFGLGAGDGGPWRKRLGEQMLSPSEMVRDQFTWAVAHGMLPRVRLFVEHGADVRAALPHGLGGRGRPPVEVAAMNGYAAMVDYLVSFGAPPPALSAVKSFIAAVLAADRPAATQMLAADPTILARAIERYPATVLRAAVTGNPGAVELACEIGFDVNALGRSYVDIEQPWETALHFAAGEGDLDLVRLLLSRGARLDIADKRFSATPLGWAEHFDRAEMVAYLRSISDT